MAAWVSLLSLAGHGTAVSQSVPVRSVKEVRFVSLGDTTRVVVELSGEVEYRSERIEGPDRVFFDLRNAAPRRNGITLNVGDQTLKRIRLGENAPGVARLVFDIESPDVQYKVTRLASPDRLIIEFARTAADRMILTPAKELLADGQPAARNLPAQTLPPSVPEVEPETAIVYPPFVPPVVRERAPRRPVIFTSEPKVNIARPPLPRDTQVLAGIVNFPNVRPQPPVEKAPPKLPDPPPVQVAKLAPAVERPAPAVIVAKKPDEPYSYKPKDTTKGPYPTEPAIPGKAKPDASMVRALGLKIGRIAIDPGHGGTDVGATGPTGLMEKDVTLDVSRRLADLLQKRLGAEVILLRNDDTAISPEQRTAMANESQADLLISIHANSSVAASATGIETFYLSFSSTPGVVEVAARENASSQRNVHEMQGLLEKIALNTKVNESREFAARVHKALVTDTKALDRGLKRAPFIVLIGAQMPGILVEMGFISNPKEEARMRQGTELQRLAESLFRGIASYAASLGQVEVAQRDE